MYLTSSETVLPRLAPCHSSDPPTAGRRGHPGNGGLSIDMILTL